MTTQAAQQASEAHAGKLDPKSLTSAAKYLYKNLSAEQLKEYTGEGDTKHPIKTGSLAPIKYRNARSF